MGRIITVLVVLTLLSGIVLAVFYQYAKPLIDKNDAISLKKAIFKVLPNTSKFEKKEKDGFVYYKGLNKSGQITGYAFKAEGNGFQDKIKLMVGVDATATKILSFEVLHQVETPGLGARMEEEGFRNQYKGLSIEKPIVVDKGEKKHDNAIVALTGATISSRAVTRIINKYAKKIQACIK